MTLYGALHGFRVGRGMGIATLEAKFAQQLTRIAHKPLFQVLLDTRNAYDYLDRGRCMENLRGYGIGQNTAHLILHHLDSLLFVPKASRLLGMALSTRIGVM